MSFTVRLLASNSKVQKIFYNPIYCINSCLSDLLIVSVSCVCFLLTGCMHIFRPSALFMGSLALFYPLSEQVFPLLTTYFVPFPSLCKSLANYTIPQFGNLEFDCGNLAMVSGTPPMIPGPPHSTTRRRQCRLRILPFAELDNETLKFGFETHNNFLEMLF